MTNTWTLHFFSISKGAALRPFWRRSFNFGRISDYLAFTISELESLWFLFLDMLRRKLWILLETSIRRHVSAIDRENIRAAVDPAATCFEHTEKECILKNVLIKLDFWVSDFCFFLFLCAHFTVWSKCELQFLFTLFYRYLSSMVHRMYLLPLKFKNQWMTILLSYYIY